MNEPNEMQQGDMWLMVLSQAVSALVGLGVDHETIEEVVETSITRGNAQLEILTRVFGPL